ncbi:hypothetical protein AUC61_14580 [Pseudomonas sp. S25]|uniref:Uncharacterized protein n=1 Tax=Pseudomonas maioricensis TaxID=1766623 RepID=A0ABS9ZJJ6_9PSED|nr:hypothetical protein [Pseudomonas sp. S25]MCI8210761.1 hypothetical protein [Pseudomonas sp. S25]
MLEVAKAVKKITTLRLHLQLSKPISGCMKTDVANLRHELVVVLQPTKTSHRSQGFIDRILPAGDLFSDEAAEAIDMIEDALLEGVEARGELLKLAMGL